MATWNINFTHIDNVVQVYLNDVLTYDSGTVDNDPELNLNVPIDCISGENMLIINLLNTSGPPPLGNPSHISYTLTNDKGVVIQTVNCAIPATEKPIIDSPVYGAWLLFNA